MATSSVGDSTTPDSIDRLADKMDDLLTPSMDTKDLELSETMLNAMMGELSISEAKTDDATYS